MKEMSKELIAKAEELHKRVKDGGDRLTLEQFLTYNQFERVLLLQYLKSKKENREMKREEFLTKYCSFNHNIRRYIREAGMYEQSEKNFVLYTQILENSDLYKAEDIQSVPLTENWLFEIITEYSMRDEEERNFSCPLKKSVKDDIDAIHNIYQIKKSVIVPIAIQLLKNELKKNEK